MSTDNKPTVQQAAKQGNPQAIAILLNRQLQPKGITAKISAKDSCLQIMLEAANVPDQKGLVTAIQKWIDGLDVDSIQRVQIYAKQTGEDIPAWNDSFEVVRQLEEPKIADTVSSPTIATETVKNDVKVEETNASKLDPALLELAKNGDTKVISELIKNTLQQPDIKVRATLNKGLLQVVLVSAQVPKQDLSVKAIPKLVQDWDSTLIEKLKVIGTREIEGSASSNIYWTEESIIAKQSIQKPANNDSNSVDLSSKRQSSKTDIEKVTQTFTFKKFYSEINPLLRYTVAFINLLITSYLSWTLIDYQNKVGKLESFFIHAKEYYNNNKPSDAATFENASINADYLIESWIAKEAKEYKKSKEEYSSKLRLNTATALFFVSILLASVYMELQIIANAKKLKLDYKEEYQLLKEELRKDPTNTALREKVLKIARLGGYDEQIIANDLSVIK